MKPILFSTPMVQAILAGRKTHTRRQVKFPEDFDGRDIYLNGEFGLKYSSTMFGETLQRLWPIYEVGEVLWVRETWKPKVFAGQLLEGYDYKADHVTWLEKNGNTFTKGSGCETGEVWKPSIFMPKDACRIFLKVKSVRAEKLHDISEEDANAEGIDKPVQCWYTDGSGQGYLSYSLPFKNLWNQINKNWEANPWVWVIEFERCEK